MNFYSYLLMYAVTSAAVLILLFYFEFRIMYKIIVNDYRTRGTLVHRCSTGTLVWKKGLYKKINKKKINQLKNPGFNLLACGTTTGPTALPPQTCASLCKGCNGGY